MKTFAAIIFISLIPGCGSPTNTQRDNVVVTGERIPKDEAEALDLKPIEVEAGESQIDALFRQSLL